MCPYIHLPNVGGYEKFCGILEPGWTFSKWVFPTEFSSLLLPPPHIAYSIFSLQLPCESLPSFNEVFTTLVIKECIKPSINFSLIDVET